MLDLETLDTRANSVILTVGGVKFDPFDMDKTPYNELYFRLEIENQSNRGRTTSESTMAWWSRQPDSIIEEAFGDVDRVSVERALQDLKKWFVGCDRVWSQGVCFDITMLENICDQYGYPVPWAFYQVQDCRTILDRMPRDPRKDMDFDAHNALEDCKVQAIALQKAFNHFGFVK